MHFHCSDSTTKGNRIHFMEKMFPQFLFPMCSYDLSGRVYLCEVGCLCVCVFVCLCVCVRVCVGCRMVVDLCVCGWMVECVCVWLDG